MAGPSGLYLDISAMLLAPASGPAIPVDEVKGIGVGRTGDVVEFIGDTEAFATILRTANNRRTLRITTGDVFAALQVRANVPYLCTFNVKDLRNGTGSGALAVSLSGAVLVADDTDAPTNVIGQSTLTFRAAAPDGQTDPLAVTQAS